MKQRLAFEAADRHAVGWAAGEHQCGVRPGMPSEQRKHAALIVARQMKEAVPGQQAVELRRQIQLAHIHFSPFLLRETLPAARDHCLRTVDAGDPIPLFDKIGGDRRAIAAAEIEQPRIGRGELQKAIEPRPFKQRGGSEAFPGGGMFG